MYGRYHESLRNNIRYRGLASHATTSRHRLTAGTVRSCGEQSLPPNQHSVAVTKEAVIALQCELIQLVKRGRSDKSLHEEEVG